MTAEKKSVKTAKVMVEINEDFRSKVARLEAITKALTSEIGMYEGAKQYFMDSSGNGQYCEPEPLLLRSLQQRTPEESDMPGPRDRAQRKLRFEGDEFDMSAHRISAPNLPPTNSKYSAYTALSPGSSYNDFAQRHEFESTAISSSRRTEASRDEKRVNKTDLALQHRSPRTKPAGSPAAFSSPAGTRSWLRRTGQQYRPEALLQDPDVEALAANNRLCIIFSATEEPRYGPGPGASVSAQLVRKPIVFSSCFHLDLQPSSLLPAET